MTSPGSGHAVVVIGVGQLRNNRDRIIDAAREPLDLIVAAVQHAAADAGLNIEALGGLDAVDVVQVVSWGYSDVAARVAERVAAAGAKTTVSGVGGHQPVARLNDVVARLARGEGSFALVCGGEAQSSFELLTRAKAEIPWSRDPGGVVEFSREVGGTERMWELGLVAPIRVYPLFENRLRHDLGQSFDESQDWSARMYAQFSEIAACNDAGWSDTVLSADDIRTIGDSNRMICYPYPLRMNANPKVDQAAAVLLATVETADELGIPEEQRVHVWSGAAADDSEDVLERPSFSASPGMVHTLDHTLGQAGVHAEDLTALDFYSCFPIVPKLAALHLKVERRPLSCTGGLSAFGGPHNNYSMHAVVAAARAVRADGGTALVYANGEYLTRHAAVLLGRGAAPTGAPVISRPTDRPDGPPAPAYLDDFVGEVVVETFTVEFDRAGVPARAYVIARTPNGERTAARASKSDVATIEALLSTDSDPIGRTGRITRVDDRRLFEITTGVPS